MSSARPPSRISQARLAEKQSRATEIDEDLKQLVANVSGHKTQIQSLMRDLEKLKEEKHDAVA
jgi:archaellum component FlaC